MYNIIIYVQKLISCGDWSISSVCYQGRFRLPVFPARASDYIERWCHASMGRRAIDLGSIQSPGSEGTVLEMKKIWDL